MKILTERQFQRREKILSTARRLIEQEGYQGVTMRELARRSSVTPKTLYDQFGSKDKLLLTAMKERFRHTYEAIAAEEIKVGFDKLVFVLDTVMEISAKNLNFARGIAALKASDHRDLVEIRKLAYLQALSQIRDEGDFLDWVNIDVMLETFYRAVSGLCFSWFSGASGTVGLDFEELTGALKLHACLVLAAYTKGNTHSKAMEYVKAYAKNSTDQTADSFRDSLIS